MIEASPIARLFVSQYMKLIIQTKSFIYHNSSVNEATPMEDP